MPTETERLPMLEMRNISKSFPGVKALEHVQLKAWSGEILSLMGENGAGKSTLMKILSGAYQADPGGEILINDQKVEIDNPIHARKLGIAIIYQELCLAGNLTVAENMFLGNEIANSGLIDRSAMEKECGAVLARLGATFTASTLVGQLSIAEMQLVEIARALQAKSKILVMDEPTTALSSRETDRLFTLIRGLRADGLAIIYISHRMAEVYELSDRVSILRDGTYVGTLDRAEINPDRLVKMMVGRDLNTFYTKGDQDLPKRGEAILDVRGITDGGRRVHPCSFTLYENEILGIAGLVGAGRTELARLIYGADRKTAGSVMLDGQAVEIRTPEDALALGIAYLTEDRKAQGLFLDMPVLENINFGVIHRDAGRGGILNRGRAKQRARDAIESLSIRVAHAGVGVGSLSGGNQQKVLLSRWLEINPRVLILDEPTRGVDIGAKSEIYRIIDRLARAGIGVLAISSELAELIGICDRVLVMREGRIQGEVGGPGGRPVTQENIMGYAAGVAA